MQQTLDRLRDAVEEGATRTEIAWHPAQQGSRKEVLLVWQHHVDKDRQGHRDWPQPRQGGVYGPVERRAFLLLPVAPDELFNLKRIREALR
jgi:hypothetical protein